LLSRTLTLRRGRPRRRSPFWKELDLQENSSQSHYSPFRVYNQTFDVPYMLHVST
jgi:hypothetical protein